MKLLLLGIAKIGEFQVWLKTRYRIRTQSQYAGILVGIISLSFLNGDEDERYVWVL